MIRFREEGGNRTALEAFRALQRGEERFGCLEYARLYVAAAREVGLTAFEVDVERDVKGNNVSHACAAVLCGDRIFLVDLSYRWFGVPHKDFKLLDDKQAIACYYFEPWQSMKWLSDCRLAEKLYPECRSGRLFTSLALMASGDGDGARGAFEAAAKLGPEHWDVLFARAAFAFHDGNEIDGAEYLRRSLEGNPRYAPTHLMMAQLFRKQGRVSEAVAEYRAALRCGVPRVVAAETRRAIVEILAEK